MFLPLTVLLLSHAGTFKRNTVFIKSVELSLDTPVLYKSMKEQALAVIRKTLLTTSQQSDEMHRV